MKNLINFLENYLFIVQIIILIVCLGYIIKYVVLRIKELKK